MLAMNDLLKELLIRLEDPAMLRAMAAVADLTPEPGPVMAVCLRLAAQWIETGKTHEEVLAIMAGYNAQAQELAKDWHG